MPARLARQTRLVRGLGLSGQMHGVVLLDSDGEVLRPAIIWADQRSEAECRQITEAVGVSDSSSWSVTPRSLDSRSPSYCGYAITSRRSLRAPVPCRCPRTISATA